MKSEQPKLISGRNDWLILAGLVIISLFAWYMHSAAPVKGATGYRIRILTAPEEIINLKRGEKEKIMITGKLGPAEIEFNADGKARIRSSTCPCKTCVNMGYSDAASLICVPNGIVVDIILEKSDFDAITR